MQTIGDAFKTKRESINIGVEEVAADLNVDVEKISRVEAGDRYSFEDVFELKEFIRTYSKYLGLDADKMIDEFNEYLFDFTSKIPVKAIEVARKEKNQKKEEIKSPYTIPRTKWKPYLIMGGIFLVIIVGLLLTYLVVYYTNTGALSGFVK